MIEHNTSDYPADWGRPSAAMIGKCPNISGTYVNVGKSAGSMSDFNCHHPTPDKGSGYWNCSVALARNLTLSEDSDDASVTIEQPTEESISVTLAHGSKFENSIVLSRKHGDFSCNRDGVEFYHLGSAVGPVFNVLAVATTQVITASNRRSFQRHEDGALVMTVTESYHYVVLVAASAWGDVSTGHIRWAAKSKPLNQSAVIQSH